LFEFDQSGAQTHRDWMALRRTAISARAALPVSPNSTLKNENTYRSHKFGESTESLERNEGGLLNYLTTTSLNTTRSPAVTHA
jgi:hypothetical protein